ncbi:sperm microtubule inner protein 6 [Ambystoma mexicanum]|uniref:sperm microtubule inner protein 6 n=1 Tax=Ambystoma mexicanum TaxID=8296 RepID=UPI0037E78360
MFGPAKIVFQKGITTYQDSYRPPPPPPKKWKPVTGKYSEGEAEKSLKPPSVLAHEVHKAQTCGRENILPEVVDRVLASATAPRRKLLDILPDNRPKPKPKELTKETLAKEMPDERSCNLSKGPKLPDWKTESQEEEDPCRACLWPDQRPSPCPIPGQEGMLSMAKGLQGGQIAGTSNQDLYWKRCQVTPEHANLSTHDRGAIVKMLDTLEKNRSGLTGGWCKTGYCSPSSGRTFMMKGVDPRVDPAPATERRLKLVMSKIARGIPHYDPLQGSRNLGPPFRLPECIPFTSVKKWDMGAFKQVNPPDRNYYVINVDFGSESVPAHC